MRKMLATMMILLAVFAVSAYIVWLQFIREEPMSDDALANNIGVMYDASPTFIERTRDTSYYEFERNGVTYKVAVDRYKGRVTDLQKLRGTFKATEESEQETQSKMLTDDEAIAIAKKQLNGEVDELSYRSTSDGGYYLIKIDDGEREAVFQIHALSGDVLSVTWDD